jgi:hypothetical protein
MILTVMAGAQEPNRSLVITEIRMNHTNSNYVQVTNMGQDDIDLSEIKFAQMGPQGSAIFGVWNDPWYLQGETNYFWLPEKVTKILKPGVTLENGQLKIYRGTPGDIDAELYSTPPVHGDGPFKFGITISRN